MFAEILMFLSTMGLNSVAVAVLSVFMVSGVPAWNAASEAAASDRNTYFAAVRDREFRDALDLYGRGMYAAAQARFAMIAEKTGDSGAEGYRVLCAVHLGQSGYRTMMQDYIDRYPYSGLIPQMRFFHALNLFDAEDYRGASEELELLSRRQLYRSQVPEFLFRKAYIGNNCVIKNSIILNDVYIGDNTVIENCIVESRDTIRANTTHIGTPDNIKIVVEKNERYTL